MLPVAVLPVAGLLLGIGATDFHTSNPLALTILSLMKNAGDVIFGNLPLIFAIGVALGFTENDGVAAIAATIGFLVMTVTLGVMAKTLGVKPDLIMGLPSIQTGVFGGILAGGLAAYMFNRFYRISCPPTSGSLPESVSCRSPPSRRSSWAPCFRSSGHRSVAASRPSRTGPPSATRGRLRPSMVSSSAC